MVSDSPESVSYKVALSRLAQANMDSLPTEVGIVCNRVLVILQNDVNLLCRRSDEPGGHAYTIGIRDCPGGPLALTVNVDDEKKEAIVLEIIYPAVI